MNLDFIPFAELLSTIVDNRGKTCPTAETGIPLIATNCVRNDLLYPAYEKVRFVSQETYDSWFRGHPKPGDLIFVTKGTPGRVCMAPDPVDFCIAQDMVAVRADEKRIYPKYLFAALRSQEVQMRIENMHVGTLIPHFKKGDFDKLLIPVPERKVQKIIGDIYFALSYKIELNRRMNETLEAIAQALFKSWFVDFDPVRARVQGRAPEGMDVATAVLFPDGFEDSELGEIPKGWRVGTLGEIANNPRRGAQPEEIQSDTPYIGLEHLPRRSIALSEWSIAENISSGKFIFYEGEILFGKLRPYFHKVGVAVLDGVCSTDILVVAPKEQVWNSFLLSHLSSDELIRYVTAATTGTRMPRTNWNDVADYKIVIPREEVAKLFNGIMTSWVKKIKSNIWQSRTLTEIRDVLLPKLISGEIRVKL